MTMSNIKSCICLLTLFAIGLSCGCGNANSDSQVPNLDPTSNSEEINNNIFSQSHEDLPETGENDDITDLTYGDDDSVPEDWLAVYTSTEAFAHFDEIANTDRSDDLLEEILSLVNKNVLVFSTMLGETFEIDRENPIEAENSETVVYPIKSQYFTDFESIRNLVFDTYALSIAKELLYGTEKRPYALFDVINGRMYVNPNALSNWNRNPFSVRSYIEITDKSDDCCEFVWHYPDIEGLNDPKEFKYFYFEKQYTSTYSDGKWVLNNVIIDG